MTLVKYKLLKKYSTGTKKKCGAEKNSKENSVIRYQATPRFNDHKEERFLKQLLECRKNSNVYLKNTQNWI